MSTGPRVPLAQAMEICNALYARWGMERHMCHVVGSVRRGVETVGDLELIAPAAPEGGPDPLCLRIQATMQAEGLFAGSEAHAIDGGPVIGRALRGLKPGFLAASLLVHPFAGVELPVQIFRYTPDNLGWMLIERTGPTDFGKYFLASWKKAWSIPQADKASRDNHLIDSGGRMVPVPTEAAAFTKCNMPFVLPETRDQVVARAWASRGGGRR